jgi:hypothetical protein
MELTSPTQVKDLLISWMKLATPFLEHGAPTTGFPPLPEVLADFNEVILIVLIDVS